MKSLYFICLFLLVFFVSDAHKERTFDYGNYLEKENIFSLVKTYKAHWFGGGASAIVDGREAYPFATKFKVGNSSQKDISLISTMLGTACALKFDIETRANIPWVSIDEVRVRVIEYKENPEYVPIFPAPIYESIVHYVEIDDPKVAKTNLFQTRFIVEGNEKFENSKVVLEKGKLETLAIRINALKSGIYNIRCELVVRYKDEEEVVILNKDIEWLFD